MDGWDAIDSLIEDCRTEQAAKRSKEEDILDDLCDAFSVQSEEPDHLQLLYDGMYACMYDVYITHQNHPSSVPNI